MDATAVVPILNVSDVGASFDWFGRLGWRKQFDWCAEPGGPLVFGGVRSGKCEIFLCRDDQGGRGEHGAWMSIWVDDADAVAAVCEDAGVDIVKPLFDAPWGVRELHIRHPDGHVMRISEEIEGA